MSRVAPYAMDLVWYTDSPVVGEDVLEFLNSFTNTDELDWARAKINGNPDEPVEDIRSADRYFVSGNKDMDDDHKKFDDYMYQIVSSCVSTYLETFPFFSVTNDSGYDILRYREGDFYEEHSDYGLGCVSPRVLSFLMYLNDDYEGGELVVRDRDAIKPKAGSVVMFPSSVYYEHVAKPVISGEKRAVVTWLEFKPEEQCDA